MNRRRLLVALALVAGLWSALPQDAEATHFRYGQACWNRVSGTTVEFTVTHAWRSSFLGTITFNTGGGTPASISLSSGNATTLGPVITDCSGGQYRVMEHVFQVDYPSNSSFTAGWSDCCRVSNLVNFPDGAYTVSTVVDLRNGNDSGPCFAPGRVQLQACDEQIRTYPFVVADADGDSHTCSFAAGSGRPPVPAGMTIATTPTGCDITWDTTGPAITVGQLYAVQAQVTTNILGNQASSQVDFTVCVVQCTGSPPTCNLDPGPHFVSAGQFFSITATGSDVDGGNLITRYLSTPPWASVSPPDGSSNPQPVNATIDGNVTGVGAQFITVQFEDDTGLQVDCSASVVVNNCNANTTGAPYDVECTGASTSIPISGSGQVDANGDDSYLWTSDCTGVTFANDTSLVTVMTVDTSAADCVQQCEVTLTVTSNPDPNQSDSCSAPVIIRDTTPPTIPTPPPTPIPASCDAVPARVDPAGQDNCDQSPQVIHQGDIQTPGGCIGQFTITRTWIAQDNCGLQSAPVQQVVNVDDTTPPVLTAGTIDPCYPTQAAAEAAAIMATTGMDNCSSLVRSTLVATTTGDCAATISVTGADDCGNVSLPVSYTTRIDGSGPDVTAVLTPADPAGPVSAVSACSPTSAATFIVGGSATDNCDGGALAVDATLHVTNTVVDDMGNCTSTTEVFDVMIGETIVLQLAAPACASSVQSAKVSTAVNSDGVRTFCGESVVLQVTAEDGCGQPGMATFDPSVDTTPDCQQTLPDGSCCPALVPVDGCENPCPSGPAKISFQQLSSVSAPEQTGISRQEDRIRRNGRVLMRHR